MNHEVYSGSKSVKFWARINALPERDKHALYLVGILLQELESRVCTWLENAELEHAAVRHRKTARLGGKEARGCAKKK